MEVVDSLTVLQVDTFPKEWRSEVKLSGLIHGNIKDYYLIDVTRMPRLEFVNCKVESHLARAVLVKTRNVLIENNTFYGGTGTAIHIGAEGDWKEGAGSQNVIVRNNRITACGRGRKVRASRRIHRNVVNLGVGVRTAQAGGGQAHGVRAWVGVRVSRVLYSRVLCAVIIKIP